MVLLKYEPKRPAHAPENTRGKATIHSVAGLRR